MIAALEVPCPACGQPPHRRCLDRYRQVRRQGFCERRKARAKMLLDWAGNYGINPSLKERARRRRLKSR